MKLDNLAFKSIGVENLNDLFKLQSVIMESLDDTDLFEKESEETLLPFLNKNQMYILGCYSNDALIAYGIMLFPKFEKENLGYDLGFAKDDLPYIAHIDSIAVNPKYRGLGLQVLIGNYLGNIAKSLGYIHLMSTVSPENYHSINNVFKQGFKIKKLTKKYNGKKRYIFHKKVL
ncbi:GNAT family N-acetyltransferase [Proteinivorax tanatarense]|uniref:GNAT family N-acetyltransferase n=1 Tax=Proteinivorax tanatarense TaxID=1260629 RepID=A0AAU7VKB1_9FIRM